MSERTAEWCRRNWFYPLLPIWLAAALGFRSTHPWTEQPALGEAVTLFDWCLFVPILYVVCYRAMPGRALLLRAFALVCGGLWIAGRIVPDHAELLLKEWGWLRAVGITVLTLVEGLAAVSVLRVAFGSAPSSAELERQGVPPLVARMILAEARFWRWVWAKLRGD